MMTKKRILVGLSGGVDSAVAAYLLKQEGHDVAVGFMKNYAEPSNPQCHTREDRNMALKVASHLEIQDFVICDFRKEYDQRIIQYINDTYKQGRTPNPDVFCNNLIKFDLFLEKALLWGFDGIATGHYARVKHHKDTIQLYRGVDRVKDQSYFLSRLSSRQLKHSRFPLGEMTKVETRALAHRIKLPNADRPDSQGLCFIGKKPIKEFLAQSIPEKSGEVRDTNGNCVGKHKGAHVFTRGQKRGLDINVPAYVVIVDTKHNRVVVTYDREDDALYTKHIGLRELHRIDNPDTAIVQGSFPIQIKIRYRQKTTQIAYCTAYDPHNNTAILVCDTPQRAVTPGQIAVIYNGDMVLGSGIIDSV